MAQNKSGKSPRNPGRVSRSKFNAFRNKQEQRRKHALKYPNDTVSLSQAKRWTEIPKAK